MEDVKVSLYKIAECGYYSRGDRKNPKFASVGDILRDLKSWGISKRLAHTKTFDPVDGGNHLPVYLVDATQVGDAWLLTLWNESHNTDGTVASINGQASVGRADVSETEVEVGHIPGHATYFWFLPEEGVMMSVRFQHPTTGVSAMNKYMRCFVERFTSYVVLSEPDDQGQRAIVGYRPDPNTAPMNLRARFKTEVYQKPGPIDEIIHRAQSIRKLERKTTLSLSIQPEKVLFQQLLQAFHLSSHQTHLQEATIKYQVEVDGLSQEEVEQVVSEWREEESEDSDYGFVFRGDSTIHWLGKEYVRETLQLDIERDNSEIVRPEVLLRELGRHKRSLLGRMN